MPRSIPAPGLCSATTCGRKARTTTRPPRIAAALTTPTIRSGCRSRSVRWSIIILITTVRDDAGMVGKRAADTYSREGLTTYLLLMEKENKSPEAAQVALGIAQRYNASWVVDQLYAANKNSSRRSRRGARNSSGKGMEKVTISSFKRTAGRLCFHQRCPRLQQAGLLARRRRAVGLDDTRSATSLNMSTCAG